MDPLFIFIAKYLYIFSLALAAVYFFKLPKEDRTKMLVFFLISLPLTYSIGLAARAAYYNPRPFVVGGFEPLIPHEADNGFPSDHLLLLSALAASMAFFDRKAAAWLWGIAALVAISRIYAGVHHFLDVSASMAIAIACAILVHNALKIYARQ